MGSKVFRQEIYILTLDASRKGSSATLTLGRATSVHATTSKEKSMKTPVNVRCRLPHSKSLHSGIGTQVFKFVFGFNIHNARPANFD